MTDLLPPYHKPMTSQLDCDLANDRVAALEAELERVRELNGELAHANVLYIGSAKRLTEDRDHHRRVGECFADKLRQAEAELTKWKEMANAQATDALDLIEARAMSGFCGYCGITPGHSVGCPVARAEALQSMLTGDAIAIVERAEQAEAALAAERELLEAALHWLTSLKQDYDEDGNGVRKWSDVYDECVANIKRLAACAARPAPEEETP